MIMPFRLPLRLSVLLALVVPAHLASQTGIGSDGSAPTVTYAPVTGTSYTSAQVTVTITWNDATVLDPNTLSITLNGQDVTGQFGYSGSNTQATSTGTLTLAPGPNTLAARICDETPNCPASPTTATYTYTAPPAPAYAVSLTPDAGMATALAGATGQTQAFTLRNTGTASADYAFTATCSGQVSCTSSPAAVTVAAGASTTVGVGYTASATAGVGHVRLAATRSGNAAPTDSGSVDVVVSAAASYAVVVPDPAPVSIGTGGTATQTFTIRNVGNRPTAAPAYTVSAQCTGAVSCTFTPLVVAPTGGQWTRVSVTYTAGAAAGTGRIAVGASAVVNPAMQDTGYLMVDVEAGGVVHPTVTVAEVTPRGTLDRGSCMRVSVGVGESECGDLVYGHALPGLRALNRARAPMLLYNSQTAHPRPVVMATVTIPAGASPPSSVSAVLRVNGVQVASSSWAGSAFTPGTARRIALGFDGSARPTGLYAYDLQVSATYAGGTAGTTATDTLAIVNRSGSPFGAGWWLNGLEQVLQVTPGMLWIGGDGSTRVYRNSGVTGLWLGDDSNATDSLLYLTGASGSYYARRLHGGGEVRYDPASGQQTATVNRVGMQTDFTWDASRGVLSGIGLPHGNGFAAPAGVAGWTFSYSGSPAYLDGVSVAGPTAGSVRNVLVQRDSSGSGPNVVRITDPDSLGVGFTYAAGVAHVWSDHLLYDAAGAAYAQTHVSWHASGKLAAVRHYAGGLTSTADDPVLTLTVPETRGWMGAAAPSEGNAYGLIDGPRAELNDWTYYWTDRNGAPSQLQDALGNVTRLHRRDWRFPGAVTYVDRPGGGSTSGQYTTRLTSASEYDDLGRVVQTMVAAPLGTAGQNAVTSYAYTDPVRPYDPTRTTSPTGLVGSTAYDALGNRLWQQAGPDASRRVFFGTNTLGQVTSVRSQRAITAGERAETMEYASPLGNLSAVVSPLGVRTTYSQDAIGRDTLVTSPVDTLVSDLGVRTPAFQQQVTRYDLGDRVVQTVSAAPGIRFPSYIAANAQPWDSVPAETITVTNTYARGLLTQVARLASPDTGHISTVNTGYRYDALGRKTVEIAPDGKPDTTWYDPAGNVVRTKSRRGKTTTLTYDALNRLSHRGVPQDRVGVEQVQAGLDAWSFPLYHADAAGGLDVKTSTDSLVVPGEEADFAYDGGGNLLRADNGDAQVRRTYYPSGALKTDTLHIRTYRGVDFGRHVYALSYTYDMEGRRTALQIPDSVAPAAGALTEWYAYDVITGALSGITDPLSNPYGFGYDDDQRLLTFTRNGFTERSEYDADGRRTRRTETQVGTGYVVHDDRYTFDVRGKQRFVRTLTDSTTLGYSGLGTLARGFMGAKTSSGTSSNERYVQDPLGNQVMDQSTSLGAGKFQYDGQPPSNERHYEAGTGRLRWSDQGVIQANYSLQKLGFDSTYYDASGNRWMYTQSHTQSTPYPTRNCTWWTGCGTLEGSTMTLKEAARQYYGADERLRVVDRRTCYLNDASHCDTVKQPLPSQRGAFEEYRYDALGQDSAMTAMEQDRGFRVAATAAVVAPDTSLGGGVVSPTTAYPGFYLGRVVYVHGGGIDHPLAIERMEYSDSLPGPITIYPHENWKGAFDLGSYDGGTLNAPCKLLSDAGMTTQFQTFTSEPGNETKSTPSDTTSHCVNVAWPAPHLWLTNRARDNSLIGQEAWNGSLVDGMRDASGQKYMRNRFYDPQSARFTQEDPIGIAGGLNVYGFGGGDPVGYSDPYGLKSCPDDENKEECEKKERERREEAQRQEEQRSQQVQQCYQNNRFSSLFGGGTASRVVEFVEMGSAASLATDAVAIIRKGGGALGTENAYASGLNMISRGVVRAAARRGLISAGTRRTLLRAATNVGDRVTPVLALTAAFTLAYNTTIDIQCHLGAIE
jgi:RHS repeat-associated protein